MSQDAVMATDVRWDGWGDPARAAALPDAARDLLRHGLGVRHTAPSVGSIDAVRLRPATLPTALRAQLETAVGATWVRDDAEARVRHTRGKSTSDLLRLRGGEADDAPDAVVLPAVHDEVVAVLAACSAARVAVVPFGGGTSVVGGLQARRDGLRGVVALDLRRLDALVAVDPVARTATLEAGLRGPAAEALLGAHDLTLGHFPQSFEHATIGGFAAARSSGQASAGYGRFDERVVALRVATPTGTLELGRAPRSAAGPDLRQLVLGSEGILGVITQVTVEVSPAPAERRYEGWRLGSFPDGLEALRALAQDGPRPTVLRLSDPAETAINLARPDALGGEGVGGCLAIVGFEGTTEDVEARGTAVGDVLRRHGATRVDGAGEHWAEGRFAAPYLRDAMLDEGALVETLETACFWSSVPEVHARVGEALLAALAGQGTPPVVLCHVSHVYASGASLYFTVGAAALDDPVAQWHAAKVAATDAIVAAGASITHHHGVGTDHRAWYVEEVGELGVAALRAVKDRLDPAGIMNPGVLLP